MPLDINGMFDLHSRALGIANQRLELLADNVANADTPNYKARDLDFAGAMQEAANPGSRVDLAATSPMHLQVGGGPNRASALYRVPEQPSLDGNTVDPQKENAAVAETAVRYQTTLAFLTAHIQNLRSAINGGR